MGVLTFKKANCRDCYRCVRGCPVKAIRVSGHQAQVMEEDCILCGNCITECPQNAKDVRGDTEAVKARIRAGAKLVASVAPSFTACYPELDFIAMERTLKRLGFACAEETAVGAQLVKTRYEELIAQNAAPVLLSSCCPTVTMLIRRYFPGALRFLAPVLSPMQAHARSVKAREPDAEVVFIGPCVSKKQECGEPGSHTDFALTFDELDEWLEAEGISRETAPELSPEPGASEAKLARFFPVSGGILQTMRREGGWRYLTVDGLEDCMAVLRELESGALPENCFVEMSACRGSCVGGHAMGKNMQPPLLARVRVEESAAHGGLFELASCGGLEHSFTAAPAGPKPPDAAELDKILRRMGKNAPEDELNCGTCGYNTCREKAEAVFFGKAEIGMCLPYMKKQAESFSEKLLDAAPGAAVTVDYDLNIRKVNTAACSLLGITSPGEAEGGPVSRFLEEFEFVRAMTGEAEEIPKRVFLEKCGRWVEQTFLSDRDNGITACIMEDVTGEEERREKLLRRKNETAALADKIVENQLRVVHEIASLLGETAAETKVALTNLKDIIREEEEES